MVALAAAKRLSLPVAPLAAAALGLVAAVAVGLAPAHLLERAVMESGLPAVVAAAEPPLGFTARLLLAGMAGAGMAFAAWLLAFLILGTSAIGLRSPEVEPDVPHVRRADAHPDAPPRAPVLATRDLGIPFLEVRAPPAEAPLDLVAPVPAPVEQPLPADLSQPLSAFDPAAIPDSPLPPPVVLRPRRPTPPRAPVYEPNERFETFELTPPIRPAPVSAPAEPIAAPETDATIHALLARLERGVARREAEPAPEDPHGLQDALASLRKLAMRG